MTYLSHIALDDGGLPVPSPEIDQERRVALFDLAEENSFALATEAPTGPYRLTLGLAAGMLRFVVATEAGATAAEFVLPLGPLAQACKDYRDVCAAYAEGVRHLAPAQIAVLDAARRDSHAAAAQQLQVRLAPHVRVDDDTARRLFTLLCAMSAAT